MKKDLSEFHAQVCKTFSHPKRLDIPDILKTGELTAGEIARRLGATKANTSQHLSLMRMLDILKTRRDGTNIYYRMANDKLAVACNLMQEALAAISSDAQNIERVPRAFQEIRRID